MLKGIVFDLDGTIYFGNKLADSSKEIIGYARDSGLKCLFITNNSRRTRYDIYEKLLGLGLDVDLKEVYTSSYLTGRYLNKMHYRSAYVFGEKSLIEELQSHDISYDDNNPDCVVVGFDTTIDYSKITTAFKHIRSNKPFIACNLDKSYPIEDEVVPGCGAMVGSIVGCAGKYPDVVVGKPSTYPIEVIIEDYGFQAQDILVVGDNYESDIVMAQKAGCDSCLIAEKNIFQNCEVISALSDLKTTKFIRYSNE